MTALRAELNAAMLACKPPRRPALRHAPADGWLLCSDVPQLLDADALTSLRSTLAASGWQTQVTSSWLYFDKPVPVPHVDCHAVLTGEAGCTASLLRRHPDAAPCDQAIRDLCHANEKGPVQVERLCRTLHADFAADLRLHKPLPGALLPYLIRAAIKEETP